MKVAILGSCVTRDTVQYWPESWSLAGYYARHPLGSLPHPSKVTGADIPVQPKGWRRLQHLRDIESSTVTHMLDQKPDLIVWDLADERLGVHQRRDGGFAAGEGVKYASDEYWRMWIDGARWFLTMAQPIPVILNAVDWDDTYPQAQTFNLWQRRVMATLYDAPIRTVHTTGTRADGSSGWGDAPFHLTQHDRSRAATEIAKTASEVSA